MRAAELLRPGGRVSNLWPSRIRGQNVVDQMETPQEAALPPRADARRVGGGREEGSLRAGTERSTGSSVDLSALRTLRLFLALPRLGRVSPQSPGPHVARRLSCVVEAAGAARSAPDQAPTDRARAGGDSARATLDWRRISAAAVAGRRVLLSAPVAPRRRSPPQSIGGSATRSLDGARDSTPGGRSYLSAS